jgi:selenocysteine lyase/cysteine desulfurase
MVEKEVRTRTKMIIATGASNVTGTLMPLGDLAEIARKHRLILAVDAAQTAGRFPIDVELEGIDVLVFTGHKELFGLQGTGGIYIREGIDFEPIMTGGTGSISSSIEQPRQMPDVLESGTLNAHGIAGLLAGASFVRGVGIDKIREHEMELAQDLIEELLRIPKMKIYGPLSTQNRVGIISFNLEGISSSELARVLDENYQIALRSGLHCSPMAHKTIGTMERGTVRAGLSYLNTHEHISRLIEALIEISKRLTYS